MFKAFDCMGDLPVQFPQPNGTLNSRSPLPSTFSAGSSTCPDPEQLPLGSETLHVAELATCEIVSQIQPTAVSEERRKAVIGYVQRLIRGYLGSELFPFGSVPLKTYLPDGDIDLTALSSPSAEEALSGDVYSMLEAEEHNQFAEFEVKDVQYIHAEVKLVKCLIQNIVVDISFNQLGGLGTLCFLEQVDRLVGKDSLFKRSIILIKAWCYYESRILGAHHGLISTYALETLVLYIFHFFHLSLDGPLAVLYRFLDYFSKFDWESYCLSLHGPVAVSSLPDIGVDIPENDGDSLLLTKDFLKNCKEMTAIPPRLLETRPRPFPRKHLNIIDPMKENNNLGRSVSKGNLYRIRSAFTYGARRLGRILSLPPENIGDEVKKFFQNTLDRHGNGRRPDVQDSISSLPFGVSGRCADSSDAVDSENPDDNNVHDMIIGESLSNSADSTSEDNKVDRKAVLIENVRNIKISDSGKNGGGNEILNYCKSGEFSTDLGSTNSVSGSCMGGVFPDMTAMRGSVTRITNDASESAAQVCSKVGSSIGAIARNGPQYHFPQALSDEKPGIGKLDRSKSAYHVNYLELSSSAPQPYNKANQRLDYQTRRSYSFPDEFVASRSYINSFRENPVCHPSLVPSTSLNALDRDFQGLCSEGFSYLADLSGDYDYHLKSLLYAQYCHEYIWSTSVLPAPSQPLPAFQSNPSWDSARYSQLKRGSFPHVPGVMAGNRFSHGPGYYPVTAPLISGAFNVEEMPKPRGTGTYFPIMNHHSYKERQSPGRGRNGTLSQSQASHNHLRLRNNGQLGSPPRPGVVPERGNYEIQPPPLSLPVSPSLSPLPSPSPSLSPLRSQMPLFCADGHKKPGPGDVDSVHRPVANGLSHADSFTAQPEVEFGTFGPVHFGKLFPEQSRHVDAIASKSSHSSSLIGSSSASQRSGSSITQGRVSQTYHLKNDDDFPPLV